MVWYDMTGEANNNCIVKIYIIIMTQNHTSLHCTAPVCVPPPSLAKLSIAAVSTMVLGTTFSFFILSNRDMTV